MSDVRIKIVVCGDKDTGKTSFISAFNGTYVSEKVEGKKLVTLNTKIGNQNVILEFVDTQAAENSVTASDFLKTRLCFLLFAVDNPSSLEELNGFNAICNRLKSVDNCRFVIIANKTDLEWKVSRDSIDQFAKMVSVTWRETCCKNAATVKEVVEQEVMKVLSEEESLTNKGTGKKKKEGCVSF